MKKACLLPKFYRSVFQAARVDKMHSKAELEKVLEIC
jgi:hypothetical protein